jgi:integrase/recombinase XerD
VWIALLGRYSNYYASNQFRALQQVFKWHATEDPDEPRLNPIANLEPPKIGDSSSPSSRRRASTRKSRGFQNRRDYAIILLFRDTVLRTGIVGGRRRRCSLVQRRRRSVGLRRR